jgi:hypothetical protein
MMERVERVSRKYSGKQSKINYITPPGVRREQLFYNNTIINPERAIIVIRVSGEGLELGDSRQFSKCKY